MFFYHANEVQKNRKKEDVCRRGDVRPFFCPLERGWYPWATNGHYPCSTTHYYSMPSWHAIFQFAGMAWPGGMRHGTSRKRSSAWEIYAVPSREHQALQGRLFQKVRTQTGLLGSPMAGPSGPPSGKAHCPGVRLSMGSFGRGLPLPAAKLPGSPFPAAGKGAYPTGSGESASLPGGASVRSEIQSYQTAAEKLGGTK